MQSFASTSRPALAKAHLATSALLLVLVLAQAALAGQALFGTSDILVHGYLGNASFTVGFVAAALAAFGRLPGVVLVLSGLALLFLFAQTGIGYIGRESATAASIHIPVGVGIFGLVTLQTGASLLTVMGGRSPADAVNR